MAAVIPALAYLIRSGSNSPANADFTCTFWAKRTSTIISGYRVFFNQLDTGYNEWTGIFSGGGFALEDVGVDVSDGATNQFTSVYSSQLNEWSPYAYVRSGTTHSFYQGGRLVGTATLDTSANVLDEQRINYDGFGSSIASAEYMYLREWGAAKTLAQIVAEWNSPTVVDSTDLWSDCPLLTDENDISGNGRDYTITGAVTFATGPTPVPLTNLTSGTAYDVTGSLPQEFVQVVKDSAGAAYTTWFKRTATVADGNELGFMSWGGGPVSAPFPVSQYIPQVNPFQSPDFVSSILGIGVFDSPIQIPVIIGGEYYFRLQTSIASSTTVPATLYVSLTAAPVNVPVSGDIYVNDDTTGFPSVVLSSTVDYEVIRFYPDMPAGEAGDIMSNGNFMLDDIDTDDYKLFDINSNLLITYTGYSTFGYVIRTHKPTDSIYVAQVRTTLNPDLTLKNYDNNGVEISSVTLNGIIRTEGIAVNDDQTILYLTRNINNQPIRRYDLANAIALSDLVAGVAAYRSQDMLFIDGALIVGYTDLSAPDFYIKRFSEVGATLNTYSLGAYIGNAIGFAPRLAYANDNPDSFWVYIQRSELGKGYARFINVRISDGVILQNTIHATFEFGRSGTYFDSFPYPQIADFGPSESCPFFLLPEGVEVTNSINVIKVTVPDTSTQEFDYTTSGGLTPSTFSLQHGENQVYSGLADGVYGVTETPVANWSTSYEVSNGDPHDAIDLAGGESVTVTVTNTFIGINPLSGIYKIVPYSYKSNDTVYTSIDPEITEDRAIPRPTFRTALLGK